MTIDDYEKVYELWMSCAGMGLNNLDDSKEGIQKFLNHEKNIAVYGLYKREYTALKEYEQMIH